MKNRVFRDPVHGLIEFRGEDRFIQAILETRPFQRLRRIKQMGFAWLVYPGAEHSRFGHALGAYHVAQRIVKALELPSPVSQHVIVAALLHDIGHGPFSHAWEEAFPAVDHEAWGLRLVNEADDLHEALESLEPGLATTISRFWDKTYQPAFARKLVSSQIDVDRLDYLLRDAHYSGAGYATYDLDWMLYALRVESIASASGAGDTLVIDYQRGMYAVEQYLFARSYMYAQVYHHKTVRAAEWMFLKLFDRFSMLAREGREPPGLAAAGALARGEHIAISEYLQLDDARVTVALDDWATTGAGDAIVADLAARLTTRRLFKTFELGHDPAVVEGLAPQVQRVAEDRFGGQARSYYEIDRAQRVGYSAPDQGDELHVVGHPRYGTVTLGRLLGDLPLGRPTSTFRLVCAPELVPELGPIVTAAVREDLPQRP
jgi:uncharacterized protein